MWEYRKRVTMKNIRDISPEDMKWSVADGLTVIIDCNGSDKYRQAHIPGAIDFEVAKGNLKNVFPCNKSTPIIVYYESEPCHAYEDCIEEMMKMGYLNLRRYAPGIRGWMENGETTDSIEVAMTH